MFYVTCRQTDTPAYLFNIEADTRGDAVQYGRSMFNRLPPLMVELYSLRNCHAIMLDPDECRFVSWRIEDDDE